MTRVSRLTQRIAGEGAAAWDIHSRALARQANGEDITVLSVGDPDFTTPRSIVEAAKHSLDQGATHYADVQGKLALREAHRLPLPSQPASWPRRVDAGSPDRDGRGPMRPVCSGPMPPRSR